MYKNILPQKPIHPNIRRLFKDSYRVRIPQGMVRSIEEQQEMPELLSGDKDIDDWQLKQLMTLYITPEKMVEYHREGVPVYICSEKDAAKVYEALIDHTSAWRLSISDDLNSPGCPAQDLLDMEKFASDIYEIAKYDLSSDAYRNPLETLRQRTNGFALNADRVLTEDPSQVQSKPSVKDKKYEPNVDIFRQALLRNGND